MDIDFMGNHNDVGRVVLGYHSLDQALRGDEGEIGWPTNTYIEIYGPTGVGKTTLAISVLAIISRELGFKQKIADLDLEVQDPKAIAKVLKNAGYPTKEFVWVHGDKQTDESALNKMIEHLSEDPPCLGLLDSVAAIASVSEVNGNIGDANMGRRAFPMAQFSRGILRVFRANTKPTTMIILNHMYENMQTVGGAKSYTAPGGVIKNNLSNVRIQVKVPYVDYVTSGEAKTEARWGGTWVLEGKIIKNRHGVKDQKFQVVIVGGQGMHPGLSAIVDCLASGAAKVQTGKLIMDGNDYGNIKKIMTRKEHDADFFDPFINELKSSVGRDEPEEDDKPKKKTKKAKK